MKFKHKRINFSKEAFGIKYIVFKIEQRITENKQSKRVAVNNLFQLFYVSCLVNLVEIHRSLQKAKNCKRKISLRSDNEIKNENRKH